MKTFELRISGDSLDIEGRPTGDLALDLLNPFPQVRASFLTDQSPQPGDSTYQDRLYSLEVTPEHIANTDGLIIIRPWIKPSTFRDGAQKLIAIGRAGIGYDKIDLTACTQNDVVVFNSPYGLTHSTASAAMIFILALSRRLSMQLRIIRDRRWDLQKEALGDDLAGKTLGIVGLGLTGRELVRLIAPYQMRVIAYSPNADPKQAAELGVELCDTLDSVLQQSDYVTLHGRLTPATHGMIGARELALLKPTAFFVNVARGEMVDQAALVKCLQERRIAGAGLDVFEEEPLRENDPLLSLDNVILTPHWLCSTREAGRATWASVIEGMLQIVSGKIPDNVLNPEVLKRPGFEAKLSRYGK